MGMFCTDLWETQRLMSSSVGDEGQGGRFRSKEVRICRLPLAPVFCFYICIDIFPVFKKHRKNTSNKQEQLHRITLLDSFTVHSVFLMWLRSIIQKCVDVNTVTVKSLFFVDSIPKGIITVCCYYAEKHIFPGETISTSCCFPVGVTAKC